MVDMTQKPVPPEKPDVRTPVQTVASKAKGFVASHKVVVLVVVVLIVVIALVIKH